MNDDKVTKTNKSRQKKEQIIAEVLDKVKKSKAMVFANYEGMTHKQIEELKKALKPADAELFVAKNTLIKRALETSGYIASKVSKGETEVSKVSKGDTATPSGTFDTSDTFGASFQGPTATIFAYSDIVSPLKALAKIIKSLKLPQIKSGILEGKAITAEDVLKVAALPTREVLLAQVVGGLKSPIFGLHRALNWNLQKLVMTLKAVEAKKA